MQLRGLEYDMVLSELADAVDPARFLLRRLRRARLGEPGADTPLR